MTDEPPLSDDLAALARRIHTGRVPVLGVAEVMFRLRQAGHRVSAVQVREAILHPPKKSQVIKP